MIAPPQSPTRRAARALLLACLPPLLAACAPRVDLKRMTYEALRREDCRINGTDDFCERTFANEYAEYERLRRPFIRDQAESVWRADGEGEPR